MAFRRKPYQQFGAEVAYISGDSLILLPRWCPTPEEAQDIALEIYYLCPEIVGQGYETICRLAAVLTTADQRSFWWN